MSDAEAMADRLSRASHLLRCESKARINSVSTVLVAGQFKKSLAISVRRAFAFLGH